jgi:Antitoxin ParD
VVVGVGRTQDVAFGVVAKRGGLTLFPQQRSRKSLKVTIVIFYILGYLGKVLRECGVMSRITIEVTDEQHQQIKAMAAVLGKSIKEFVLERLFPSNAGEEERAWQELKELLGERIAAAERGEVSTKTFSQIFEEKLAAMGKA